MSATGSETAEEFITRKRIYKHRASGERVETIRLDKRIVSFRWLSDGAVGVMGKRDFYRDFRLVDSGR